MTAGWRHQNELPIPASRDRLFQALTDAHELERWFAEHVEIEPRVGGPFRFWGRHTIGTPAAPDSGGVVRAFEPQARLAFTWRVYGVASTVTIALTPAPAPTPGTTHVTVRHQLAGPIDQPRPKALIDDWWRFTLGNLMAHVTGGEVFRPDFADRRPEVRLTMVVDAPAEAVFHALTDPDALRDWMGAPDPVVEPRVGGCYRLGWTYPIDGRDVAGGPTEILDIVPNERLVLRWPDWRGDDSVPAQSITWQLEPDGGRTRVTLLHQGFTRAVDVSDYPFGWRHFLGEMARVAAAVPH